MRVYSLHAIIHYWDCIPNLGCFPYSAASFPSLIEAPRPSNSEINSATSAVQPVWWLAPRPCEVSP